MLLPRQHCFWPLLKCVSLLSEVVTSARTLPWFDVCIVGTGSAGASETPAGDDGHLRAVVFLPFLFRGLAESLNSVKLVCVHQWPWFSLESASCWSTDLSSSSLWTFTWSSSIQDAPHPNLILWDIAAASEVMSPQALSLRWSTFWGFFDCQWSLQRSPVFPQKQKDLSWLAWSTVVWTLFQVLRLACGALWWGTGLVSFPASCSLVLFPSQGVWGSGPPRQIGLLAVPLLLVGCLYVVHVYLVSIHLWNFAPSYFFPSNYSFNCLLLILQIYSTVCNSGLYTVFLVFLWLFHYFIFPRVLNFSPKKG